MPARDAERPEAQASVGRALMTIGVLIWLPYLYFRFVVPERLSSVWLLALCGLISVLTVGFSVALLLRSRRGPT